MRHCFLRNYVVTVLFCSMVLCSCGKEKKAEVGTDVAFVQEQFPEIEDIQQVKYCYHDKTKRWEIGLQNIEFCGFIKIGDDFFNKITKEYKWKETKKSKKKVPNPIFEDELENDYHFTVCDDFWQDGKYISHSWGGEYYLDMEKQILYFECEW